MAYLDSTKTQAALGLLQADAPGAARASRDALHRAWLHLLSKPGKTELVRLRGDSCPGLDRFDDYIRVLLADPAYVRDLAIWALFFATRAACDDLQFDHCPRPTSESHLSGKLLGALRQTCETWRKIVAEPLGRSGASVSLDEIDLSILGGEQATGGDFALVLDFASGAVQPGDGGSTSHGRIVPLIFQAKRYLRPRADVSQHHPIRGYQRTLLAANHSASAYIFYENGTLPVEAPLPPLVKPVSQVGGGNRTDALEGSLDLAAYLVATLCHPAAAPAADNAQSALEMIYAEATPGRLAIISSDGLAHARYQAHFHALAARFRDDSGHQTVRITD